MFRSVCVVFCSQFHLLAGELPEELGNLVELNALWLNDNEFQGELYVSSYTRNLVAHTTEFWCVHCTVTEEEKAAHKAKFPKLVIFDI